MIKWDEFFQNYSTMGGVIIKWYLSAKISGNVKWQKPKHPLPLQLSMAQQVKVLLIGFWNLMFTETLILFFSDRLLFFLLINKYLLSIFSATWSTKGFFKAPNASSWIGLAWQIILEPSARVIYFFLWRLKGTIIISWQ